MPMDEVDDRLVVRFLIFLLAYVAIFICYYGDSSIWKKRAFSHDLHAAPLPNRIMRPFELYNGSLLSPEGQDQRWNDFSQYYIHLQSELAKRKLDRYVIYTTTNSGLANKLNGLVSSLLVAMVTNRGLKRMYGEVSTTVVDEWLSFDSYFHLPLESHHYFKNCIDFMGYER